LSVTPQTGNLSEPVTVSFDVRNTGHRAAAEVAELKGFARVNLRPGEISRVTLKLDRRAFSFYDVTKKDWSAEPGEFTILVGGSSDSIQLRSKFTLAR